MPRTKQGSTSDSRAEGESVSQPSGFKRTRAYQRKYYRTHPEFQAKQRANAIANNLSNRRFPEYRRLSAIRKDLYRIRESYNARMEHANRLERRLVDLASQLAVAEQEWAKVRALEARTQLTGQGKRPKATDSTP